ncbi:hypothetical protein V494_04808 [Pseudogymnoascus sp. VKM F-4513 (FW-928)]|nr:hypothetical protein V494_04808 [Pseudogymnoascus sp. VKM F-4513 (FW-928)]
MPGNESEIVDDSSDIASENEYDAREEHDDEGAAGSSAAHNGQNGGGEARETKKPKLDPKDPLRPRRKKARRACFACQRAHLTCGDERPCQRCIKRNLADACQDGVRKKAKYLHDAPPEALRPVLGPNYNAGRNGRTPSQAPTTAASDSSPGVGGFFPQVSTSPTYTMPFQQLRNPQMAPPMPDAMPFMTNPSPLSPSFVGNQQLQGLGNNMTPAKIEMQETNPFANALFDPSNPALFNFDLDSLNFGNHYGAMEFSMLNHMSSGAAETPPQDQPGSSHGGSFDAGNMYNNATVQYNQLYPQQRDAMLSDYGSLARQDSAGNIYNLPQSHHLPRAFAIEAGPMSNASPSTDNNASPQQSSLIFDTSPKTSFTQSATPRVSKRTNQGDTPQKPVPKFQSVMAPTKRGRDPSSIYTSVTEPYSYTTGFHALTAFIQRRFSANATLRIAKSLGSIRPSFISCTKTLNREDLIFMEKCFQRTLFEYEDFMRDCSTPTLVCRRSGEVAAVNKEFSLLTGWGKNVLMGREKNENVNRGRSGDMSAGSSQGGRSGMATPRVRPAALDAQAQAGRPSYVLLAELMDDDSVVEFYEDFARLAFGDSRGSVRRKCKLLKYQTKEGGGSGAEEGQGERPREERPVGERVSRIDGEWGIGRLEKDGKLDCSYCWTVKRDVFDIPMLIVMNFLPCI